MAARDTRFWFAYAVNPAGQVVPVAVRAERLCDRAAMLRGCAERMGARGGVALFSYVLDVKEDRAVVSCEALDDVAAEVGEAFFVAMIGRSRALTVKRWGKFRASLARGVGPYVVGSSASFREMLAKWARGVGVGRDLWARLANLFWWYRNRRGDGDLLPLLLRIRGEKTRLRSAGVSWAEIARVSVCLKRRGGGFDCACAMCRHLRVGRGDS